MSSIENISWSVERRLQFIEFRLYWDGRVNRSDLMNFFGISTPQASADIGKYLELAPNNMKYDAKVKTYLATEEFQPVLANPNAQQYLMSLRSFENGTLSKEETWLDWMPPLGSIPTIARRVDPEILRKILSAIRTESAIHIEYQSLSRDKPLWRWLTPHALAFDGLRWHVRAWCDTRQDFRDFVLARVINAGEMREGESDPYHDVEWNRLVTLKIGPHPDLSDAARQAIEIDFGMQNGQLAISTRVCMSYYLERRFNLDLDPAMISPQRQQIVLLNRDEVLNARTIAENESNKTRSNRDAMEP